VLGHYKDCRIIWKTPSASDIRRTMPSSFPSPTYFAGYVERPPKRPIDAQTHGSGDSESDSAPTVKSQLPGMPPPNSDDAMIVLVGPDPPGGGNSSDFPTHAGDPFHSDFPMMFVGADSSSPFSARCDLDRCLPQCPRNCAQ
jgi:hypothetical protein